MNLQGKTAIVTGGGRGIGRAVCLELARGGADIVLCYAGGEATARQTAGACEALGGDILGDAFGIVALVAMTPLVTIQILGLWYQMKLRTAAPMPEAVLDDIIEYDLAEVL